MSTDHDDDATWDDFHEAVNMTPAELKRWLDTGDSKSVGQKTEEGSESVGHESGRHIIRILEKKKADLTADDYAHMRKVIGYVHRHKAQGPGTDAEHSPWRFSLMNWGHDPQK